MFKIESYITPIIINYIDKYVKDFRPQNAQVSLWGGEVTFQNLDIRLDILQQELHLPLTIVSGHIHELTIRIPWTKIASEPIQININTIEFVVKLKSDDGENVQKKENEMVPNMPINQEPPGYMASLINKIANNISVKLNNIIFKYIEEDIVMSMNIQLLTIDSADNNWQPAFIDINSTKVVLKKVINVTDLTICLDKRNAQGKITLAQEPILYRCSMQARMIRKYNLSTAHLSSSTRIDIFTDFIDFKLSVQQYPMLIRLYLLIQMLRECRVNVRVRHRKSGENGNDILDLSDGSYVTWMWNMLPELFPKEDEEDDDDNAQGHIYHTGFYANKVNITLKSQELVSGSIIHSTTSIKYHPFLKITLYGMYFDAVTVGRSWYNLKGGISYVGVFPVGTCTCGKKHNLPTVFLAGKKLKDEKKTFLADSLKDPDCCENNDQNRIYNRDHEKYFAVNTEDALLKKSPAIAIDIVSFRYFLDDAKTYASQSVSEMDFSSTTEEYQGRTIFGSLNFKFDTSLIHMWKTLNESYEQYDYSAPYLKTASNEITLSQLTPPLTEDFDSLVQSIPLRRYQFIFKRPQMELHFMDSDHLQGKGSTDCLKLPFLLCNFGYVDLTMTSPLYPLKLIHTTCQLPNPPEKLKANSFWKIEATVTNCSMEVLHTQSRFTVLALSNFQASYDALIKPDFWKLIKLPNYIYNLRIPSLTFTFNKPQFVMLNLLIDTYRSNDFNLLVKNIKHIHVDDLTSQKLSVIEFKLSGIQLHATVINNVLGVSGVCKSIAGKAIDNSGGEQTDVQNVPILSNEYLDREIVSVTIQLPSDISKIQQPPIIRLNVDGIVLNMNVLLQDFLNYKVTFESSGFDSQASVADDKVSSRKQWIRKNSRVNRSLNRTESVHSNSAATLVTVNSSKSRPKESLGFFKWYNLAKCLVVYFDIKPFSIVCSHISDTSHTTFRFPSVLVQTSKFKYNSMGPTIFPISLADASWSREKSGFPWNIELNNFSCFTGDKSEQKFFLNPVNTKITLDITDKLKDSENGRDDISFVIHLDTMPIEFNFTAVQLQNIYRSASLIATCFNWLPNTNSSQIVEAPAPPTTLFDFQINEFIGETTNSERSSEEVMMESDANYSKFNFLVQWTITKLVFNMFGRKGMAEIKVAIELEDIISSVDKQSAYAKIKTKCGSMNGIREIRNGPDQLHQKVDLLTVLSRSDTLVDNAQDTFFELVATNATTHNVHNRWGAKKVNLGRGHDDTITEVMITMQATDIKLELDMLSTVLPIINCLAAEGGRSQKALESAESHTLNVRQLPLIFFNCKGFQMWIPTCSAVDHSDVLILKMNSITITHTVENPIQRKPVRDDIYTKACQLRIIHTPGSEIEDRQYELLFKNISIGTGNWKEILNFTQPSPANFELNPAFDWNNQTQKPSLNLNTIFEGFIVSVIYAPSIVFQNILVCGQALEVNCVNDLHIKTTLSDLSLINNLMIDFRNKFNLTSKSELNRSKAIQKMCKSNEYHKISRSKAQIQLPEHYENDSGFKSHSKKAESLIENMNGKGSTTKVPFALSFVGGYFSIKLYKSLADVENRNIETEPLFSLSLMQPNIYIIDCSTEYSRQFSLFNMTISLFDKQIYEQSSEEFGEIIFNTSIGQLDESGIPPCLLYMKSTVLYPSHAIQLIYNIRKPIKLRLTPLNLEKVFTIKDMLSQIFISSNSTSEEIVYKPIGRNNKIKAIKEQLLEASNIEFSMAKTDICLLNPNACGLTFSFLKFDAKVAIQKNMERLSVMSTIDSFLINSEYSIILHPMTARYNCILTQSKWNKHLSTSMEFHTDYVGFQICPNDVLTIAKTQKAFLVCISRGLATFAVVEMSEEKMDCPKGSSNASPTTTDTPLQIILPTLNECLEHSIEEHFQDDLRLGAFQYVDVNANDAFPLAYQINIFSDANDLKICWRYPHPRVINYMRVFPVPLQLSVNINCQLQYFLEAQNAFIPLCTFQINEKISHEISLPKRKVTASVWRIVIFNPLAFESDRDEYMNIFRDMLHPRALIGCIRIDSMFSNKNLPMIQINVNVKNLSLTILNSINLNSNEISPLLKQYTLKADNHLVNIQEYCRVDFPNIMANMCLFSDADWTLYNEFTFGVSIFDYSYLQMEKFIENVAVQTYVENSSESRKGLNVCYALVDNLHIKYAPNIGHTIAISDQIWREIFSTDDKKNFIPILTRYVMCNSTSVAIKFGQLDTDEQIWLRPNECHFYAFNSTKRKQCIRISIDSECEVGTDAAAIFPINESHDMQYIPINHDRVLLITQKKLSTTQRQIIVKGQIEMMNMCKQSFQIHYKNNTMLRSETDDGQIKLNSQCVILINGETNGSIFAKCDPNTDHIIRLHLAGADGIGWSGEIPLHAASTNVPWLVKVPTKNPQKYVSFSVRIHREFITDPNVLPQKQQRLLIVIWPLFTARSFLPHNLLACDKENERNYTLNGKGVREDFQIAGTYDTDHEFLFNVDSTPTCATDKWKTVLSYKSVDRKSLFNIPDRLKNINDIIKELEKPDDIKWPYANDEEAHLERPTTEQRSALPLYKFSPSRELSCSLLFDVLPWCLFINSLGCEIKLINANDCNNYTIEPNHIGCPFMITTAFTISINYESGWKNSCLIYLNDCKPVHRSQLYYKLPPEGSVLIEILANGALSKFRLTSKIENSTRIITLAPYFVVCNLSRYALKVHPFCLLRNEKLTFEMQPDLRWNLQSIDLPLNKKSTTKLSKGIGINSFQSLSPKPLIEAATERNMNYFVVASIDEHDFSTPMLISKNITRTAFGLRHDDNRNSSFALSALEYLGQIYIVLYDDHYPFAEIENRTNIQLYVAESESIDVNRHAKPRRTIHEDNFQWFKELQPFKRTNFTPSSVNENFPEKPITNIALLFGCTNKLTSNVSVQWSMPMRVDECEEKFLNLPIYGDIKLTLYKSSKTICILIEHINARTEFNVKNILTKLSSQSTEDLTVTEISPLLSNTNVENNHQPHVGLPIAKLKTQNTSFFCLNTDVFIKGITITLYEEDQHCAHKKNEIVSLYLDDVAVFFEATKRTIELCLGNIQLDNNLISTGKYDFPVVLCGQKSIDAATVTSLFSIGSAKENLLKNNLAYFKFVMDECTFSPDEIHCCIKPFTAFVEDRFIAVILDFCVENLPTNIVHSPNANQIEKIHCAAGEVIVPRLLAEQIITLLTDPLRISYVCIKPLNILLSVHTCMRMYIALDHSPLDFSQFEMKNIYSTTMKMGYNVGMHYVSGAIFGVGWVVGSLEILGSPSGLARSVTTGLWDFVSLPVQGLFRGPWGFLLGLTHGSASLLKNVTAGTLNSVSRLASSFARNLDRLTLDDEHLQRTEALRRVRPQGITDGFTQGLTGFGINLLGAVGGIARHALEARSSVEVFTGLGRGLVGVVTKPISGAAELLALTGQGVLHSVGFNTMPTPRPLSDNRQENVMTTTKIIWKISSDPLRFATLATASLTVDAENIRLVTVALTSKLIILISMETNTVFEMFPVNEITASIDTDDASHVILAKADDSESSQEYQFHYNRILQYVTKSHEQLGIAKPIDDESFATQNFIDEKLTRKVILHMDPIVAQYFVKYVELVNLSVK